MKPIVYIDVLFLVNFLINSALLYVTSKICKKNITLKWISMVSALAALYAAVMFFPRLGLLYSMLFKLIFSIGIIAILIKSLRPKELIKATAVFFMVSLVFAGAVFGIICLTNAGALLGAVVSNGQVYFDLNYTTLILAAACSYGTIFLFTRLCRNNYSRDKLIVTLIVSNSGKSVEIKGLIDTGCYLCEPITEKPAIAVHYNAIKDAAPFGLERLTEGDIFSTMAEKADFVSQNKIKLLPFSSFGGGRGLIPAFVPECIIEKSGKRKVWHGVLVGVTNTPLSDGLYDAVINPDIFKGAEENGLKTYFKSKKQILRLDNLVENKEILQSILHRRERSSAAASVAGGGEKIDCRSGTEHGIQRNPQYINRT